MNIQPCDHNLLPILSIINAAAEAYRGVIPPDCWHDPYMSGLIAGLLRHSGAKSARDEDLTGCIRRARQMIDDDPAGPLTLTSLAKEAGLSKYRLLRSFARELGLTPHAYIVQRRIACAQQLIRGGRGLAEAALAAGFYDQSHLTRCFVRQLGVTPRGYSEGSLQTR